jgi:predicted HAD superfamily Cof-like phosphohydrolase
VTNFEKVKEFMKAFGQTVLEYPEIPSQETLALRYELIREELEEFDEAIKEHDLVGMADALADILYVTYGAMAAIGLPADKLYEEVHRSNMSKLGPDGKPIYRSDGKVLKGPDYSPPNLKEIVDRYCQAGEFLRRVNEIGMTLREDPSSGWERSEA